MKAPKKGEAKPPLLEEHIYQKGKNAWLQIERIIDGTVFYQEITQTAVKAPPGRTQFNVSKTLFLEMIKRMQYCEKCSQPAKVAVVQPPKLAQLLCKDHSPIKFNQ